MKVSCSYAKGGSASLTGAARRRGSLRMKKRGKRVSCILKAVVVFCQTWRIG
jgi:hypothetical protein